MVSRVKRLALIAHDNEKPILLDWARAHLDKLSRFEICATGTTGTLLETELGLKIQKYKSGPLGGDLQIGSNIAEGKIDWVIFFWDPLRPHPHDVDVKALLRIVVVYDIPLACNRASADLMMAAL